MKNLYIIWVLVLVVLGFFVFMGGNNKLEAPTLGENTDNTNVVSKDMPVPGSSGVVDVTVITTSAVKEFTITAENFSFSPSLITVKKGDRVKITFKNSEGFHDFVVDEFGVATKQTKAPTTEVLEFTADKVGSFEYYCSVGTHRAMGMKGTLKVE